MSWTEGLWMDNTKGQGLSLFGIIFWSIFFLQEIVETWLVFLV